MGQARTPGVRLTGAALLNLCLGTLFTWSVFLTPVERELSASRGEISAVFSASLVVFAAAVVLAGRLVGRLRSDVIAAVSAAGTAAGMLVASRAGSVMVLGLGYVGLVGVANGLGYLTAVDAASAGFGRRRGLATGVIVAAYAGGPVLAGPLAAAVLPALGWRDLMAGSGVVLGITMLGAAVLMGAGSTAPGRPSTSTTTAGLPSWARRGVLLLWAVFLTGALPGLFAFGHAASIMAGQAARAGGLVVAGMGVGNVFGRAVAGAVSDHFGRHPVLVSTLGGIVVASAVAGVTRNAAVVIGCLIVLGAGYGALSTLMPAATADLVGPSRFGRVYGWVFTGWGIAGLLGPLLGAVLHDRTGDYLLAFRVSAAVAVLGLVGILSSSTVAHSDRRQGTVSGQPPRDAA